MNDENNSAGFGLLAGAVLLIWLGSIAMKTAHRLFHEIEKLMNALGAMLVAFLEMLFEIAKVTLAVAVIGGALACAVYFTYRYIMMIRRGTDLQREVDQRLHSLEADMSNSFDEFKDKVGNHLVRMDRRLNEALQEPDPIPQLTAPKAAIVEVALEREVTGSARAEPSTRVEDIPPAQPY